MPMRVQLVQQLRCLSKELLTQLPQLGAVFSFHLMSSDEGPGRCTRYWLYGGVLEELLFLELFAEVAILVGG
ncbi:uncharacterized protein PHALS_12881 [Plasmopara halstedii]|uniref:Uncharacterized protein n=1 Tax=Plasmopara halstedii TaxID=4781 RepID=A0A0P1AMZ7_PLAHL|nr:uncharacterized protein PHALS_12881 [Plasmopara halstedii]CEG42620.1 hypothetical protein PHALS_12881 [Plasmopara halstedii]|eukprot:XP_024578989.1 hypothetical protein PHALS_12881 [Plasmopara halstedii]